MSPVPVPGNPPEAAIDSWVDYKAGFEGVGGLTVTVDKPSPANREPSMALAGPWRRPNSPRVNIWPGGSPAP